VRFRLRKHADILLPTKNWSILNWLSNMESVVFDCFLNFLWLWYIIKLAITFNTHIIEVLALGYFIRVCFSQLAFILVLMVSERVNHVAETSDTCSESTTNICIDERQQV
jgi:poly-beta-1,6-N-acetyl-D-glucosamine synthase